MYSLWDKKYQQALGQVVGHDELVGRLQSEIESDMRLVGSTAIEDKLQDEVAETIRDFKSIGIKVWVLTGDKVETAINIGYSAGLLDPTIRQFKIKSSVSQALKDDLETVVKQLSKSLKEEPSEIKLALIIAGESLNLIAEDGELLELFLHITDYMDVVIACRVSPKQKGDIVEMIRDRFPDKMTLAVGDGANDVAMILKAHVGVGIAGREGMQATRSSDYAIGQFRFLRPLLFFHGREAYRRNSFIICYNFYKNFLYVVVQYFFGIFSVFSG